LKHDYQVFVTADHGSVEAVGAGQPQEGVLVEQRAMRARIYEQREFADSVAASHPHARRWDGSGLPSSLHVLVPAGLYAFARQGDHVLAHGGISLEEVIVPFVRIDG
jgi:hypothetical protein